MPSLPTAAVVVALAATASAPADLRRCEVGQAEARCGTVTVPERRAGEAGRSLDLFVAVVGANGENREPDPIVVLEGGPGASVTRFAALHVRTFAGALRHRDLVLLDQRGTGRSAPLDCDLMDGFRDLPTREGAAACAATLAAQADLAHYTTAEAVEDLAAVLDRLGYERVNLFGVSNGSRTALRFLAVHPDRVRTLVLLGPYPTTHNVLLDGAETLDLALAGLAAACAAEPACGTTYPTLERTIETLPGRFVEDADWPRFAAALRMMLFFPPQAARVPQLLDAAARSGRLPAFLEAPADEPQASLLAGWISQGAFMSLLCSEDAARAPLEQIRRRAEGTFLGSGWAESLALACESWPRKPLPADFARPVHADVPALLLVGGLDPAVQPAWAREIAATLPRARVVVVPEGQHSFVGMSGVACVVELIDGLVATAAPEALDVSCTERMRRPAFLPPGR
jgi:pimeloyl-ACP methyl ester carboxylesterase